MLKNRYYVTEIFDIVKFLSSNELSFRGDDESFSVSSSETCPSFGLFLRLFEFTLVRDTRLQEEMKYILEVATYELPEIQNEVLEIMATTVCENIADKCRRSDIRFYCIKVDGTEGHSGYEMISTVLQFVYEGKVEEHLLGIVESENMQAVALCDVILNGLEIAGLDPRYIISQCYDGASVMAGVRGGVQALMQERVKKIYTSFWRASILKNNGHFMTLHFIFPNAYKIAATVFTIAYETYEASFSTCSRILIPFWRSVSKNRMRNLVLLPFERKLLLNMPDDNFLKRFKAMKNRRLQ
ncbi:hypothetical protein T11_504 [Trichinella zimbabwensis]|uniref:DUF4371 domain-containing protein n=1 Tax=Trichinella zimbabwensis TaxID=268475 RepID=A0A0V1I2W2_9BILA|nr:hypothetical protein T11_504 [Trichinella zimbabwensis]